MTNADLVLSCLATGPKRIKEISALCGKDMAETVSVMLNRDKQIIELGRLKISHKGPGQAVYALPGTPASAMPGYTPPPPPAPPKTDTLPADGAYRMAGRITVRQIVFPGSRRGFRHGGML